MSWIWQIALETHHLHRLCCKIIAPRHPHNKWYTQKSWCPAMVPWFWTNSSKPVSSFLGRKNEIVAIDYFKPKQCNENKSLKFGQHICSDCSCYRWKLNHRQLGQIISVHPIRQAFCASDSKKVSLWKGWFGLDLSAYATRSAVRKSCCPKAGGKTISPLMDIEHVDGRNPAVQLAKSGIWLVVSPAS